MRSFEVPERGGIQEGRDNGEGERGGEKDVQNLLCDGRANFEGGFLGFMRF